MKCPICNSSSQPQFVKHEHTIYACDDCKHQFIDIPHPSQHANLIYTDDYFFEGGSGYSDYTREADLLIAHGERYGKILAKYTQPTTLFDVGAAAGFILKGLTQTGWTGKGIEVNHTMAQYAQQTLNLDIMMGSFEDYQSDEQFDLVTMIQVIGHFYDVRQAINVAKSLLRKDGLLLIESWNRDSFPARLLGSNWHEYSPPSVVNWFSHDGLNSLLHQCGFEEVAHGRPDKRIAGSHAKSLVNYKLENMVGGKAMGKLLNVIPDSLQIPYPSFDLFWVLYRLTK